MKYRLSILVLLVSLMFTYCTQITEPTTNDDQLSSSGQNNTPTGLYKNIGGFDAPTNLKATVEGNDVIISWTAPDDVLGNSPVTYLIVFGGGSLKSQPDFQGTTLTLQNLPAGEYSVKVKAEEIKDSNGDVISGSGFSGIVNFTINGSNITDDTPPTIILSYDPMPNSNGWNNTNVTVSYTAYDESGFSSSTPSTGSFTFTTEGNNQTHTFIVTDAFGNSAEETATVNIDKTKPVVDLSLNGGTWANGFLILGSSLTLNTTASDNLSGVYSVNTNGTTGNTAVWTPGLTGNFTLEASATDNADNFSVVEKTVSVAYKFNGWRPPVSISKSFKSGSTLPVKFLVVDATGNPVVNGVNVIVRVGSSYAVATLDDASTGQYKAEVKLSGTGTQTVSLEGDITPASLSITVK